MSIGTTSLVLAATFRRGTTAGTEAAGDYVKELAVHRAAHDVTEDRAARADECARHDEQVIAQHEAGRRRGPARVAVEHRDDDGHVGAADRHHHVNAEQQREDRHDDERHDAATGCRLHDEGVAVPERAEQQQQVQPVTRRQQQRVPADPPRQLAECDHGTGEGHRADQDTEVGLDVVNSQFDSDIVRQSIRIHEVGKADRHRSQPDEAVQYGNQFRHLRHLHAPGGHDADAAADQERHDQQSEVLRNIAHQGRYERNRHAGDSVPVAAPRGLLVGQPAQGENEQDGRDDVRDLDDSLVYLKHHDLTF